MKKKTVAQVLSKRTKKRFAIHLDVLARMTGLSEREVRKEIERLRRNGVLIVSDLKRGYWITSDESELRMWLRQYVARAKAYYITAKPAMQMIGEKSFTKLF